MRPSRRNHVVITFIEFLSSAKHLACCQHNLGLAMPMVEPPSRLPGAILSERGAATFKAYPYRRASHM